MLTGNLNALRVLPTLPAAGALAEMRERGSKQQFESGCWRERKKSVSHFSPYRFAR